MKKNNLRITPKQLQISKTRVTPGFLFCAALLFYQGTPDFLLTFALAAAIHEIGHLLTARCLQIPVRSLSMTAFGCVLTFENGAVIHNRETLLIASAGPAVNLIAALLCMAMPWRESITLFGAEHLLLALFNLLPVPPLDGAVMLTCLLSSRFGAAAAEHTVNLLSAALTMMAVAAAVWFRGVASLRMLLFAFWIGVNILQKMCPHPCQSHCFPLK